ncbi:MAG: TetR/AcrR family transcriptional regulator, partial [Gammaproteobacteria bacterium]|nr:TetR/AcrR family transcriptional regulator [Gammaproteobacteria bacterium]
MRSNNKKEQILEAALQVVEENGANHLTIDAVATYANFSKGGVLYHFPSKKALLSGMVDHLIQANEKRM